MLIRKYIQDHRPSTIIGIFLFGLATLIIFWNEKRAVRHSISLDEALSDVISVNLDDAYNPAYEGKVVHLTGPILTGEPLTEPDYNIQVQAVKLRRRVQMLQWVEETTESVYGSSVDIMGSDSSANYYYSREWRDQVVDTIGFHSRFGHENPDHIPIESRTQVAELVQIGYYELGLEAKSKIEHWTDFTSDARPDDPSVKLHSGFYYHSDDVFDPIIGDIRIMFSFAGLEGSVYTVTGQWRNGKIEPFVSRLGVKVLMVHKGENTPGMTLKNAHYSLSWSTWSFRLAGWLVLFLAVLCTSSLIAIIFSQLPLLWTLAPDARHSISGNVLITFVISFAIVSLAWMLQRPWIGVIMMTIALSPLAFYGRAMVRYDRVPAV